MVVEQHLNVEICLSIIHNFLYSQRLKTSFILYYSERDTRLNMKTLSKKGKDV